MFYAEELFSDPIGLKLLRARPLTPPTGGSSGSDWPNAKSVTVTMDFGFAGIQVKTWTWLWRDFINVNVKRRVAGAFCRKYRYVSLLLHIGTSASGGSRSNGPEKDAQSAAQERWVPRPAGPAGPPDAPLCGFPSPSPATQSGLPYRERCPPGRANPNTSWVLSFG